VGDFNADGNEDLAVPHGGPTAPVSILLGNGAGDFSPAPTSPEIAGTGAASVVVADFDANGTSDLAIANSSSVNVTILLGNGAGDFSPAPTSPEPAGSMPQTVAVGDFNADGRPDLVAADQGTSTLAILIGTGGGDFTAAATSPETVSSTPDGVVVGDFNADGKADLAATKPGFDNVEILLGSGDGDFAIAPTSPEAAGNVPREVVVGDFNGDNQSDLAVANQGDAAGGDVTILLGAGGGDFSAAPTSPEPTGLVPVALAVSDFQQDGIADLAVANSISDNVATLLGVGNGDFTPALTSPEAAGNGPQAIAKGDFNKDGIDDFAVAASNDDSVPILLGLARILNVNPNGGLGGGFVDASRAGIDCGTKGSGHTDCSNPYASGAQITVTAHPGPGSGFQGFVGGACTASSTTCTVTLDNPAIINAVFTDIRPPQTEITKKPKKRTTKDEAKIRFEASEKGSKFTCQLDNAKPKKCSSPFKKHVRPGKHVFEVFATDPSGNEDRTPAKVRWKVLED
jgi:hypothetical protein